jgi:choline dehydrogenase
VERYEVIVLGGGAAGCVLAARVSADPARTVCLVEAGPDHGPRAGGGWPAELLDPSQIPETHDWRDEHGSLPCARVIGGSSAHNACGVTRAPAAEYDGWAEAGGDAWCWATLEPCLRRAREQLGARARAQDEIGAWHTGVLAAMLEAGLAPLDDLDAESTGAGIVATNVTGGARNNAAFAYLDPARPRPNLTIHADTLADRVVLEGSRAAGAVVRGPDGERTIQAGRVILAAGSYGSAAILLRSGIGPEPELRGHGIPVRHALPGVGRLSDHCRVGLGFALRDNVPAGDRTIVAQAYAKWRSSLAGDDPWDLHVFAIVPPDGSHGRITAGLVAPRSGGSVGLRSRDPAHLPRVDHGLLSHPDDVRALAEGVEWTRALASTTALARLTSGEIEPGSGIASADYVRAAGATFYHPTGTCALGAVVDGDAAVRGVDGLHVGDASLIPHSPRAGTHLTALAVAERVAELV